MPEPVNIGREYLAATETARAELVLLHGWGSNRAVWRPLLATLRPWANITLLDIPGLAPGLSQTPLDLDLLLAGILDNTPERAVFLGWSLGGQLALALADRHAAKVEAVITLCGTPCFVEHSDWPGMPAQTLQQFTETVKAEPAAGLRRFDSLQVAGADAPKRLMRMLQGLRGGHSEGPLELGLSWLASLDQRQLCRQLALPQLHLVGERDGLLAAGMGQALETLLADIDGARVEVVKGASHVAPLEQGQGISSSVFGFLASTGLLSPGQADAEPMAKADIALSFSRAAQQYDSVASLQRDVGSALLSRLDELPCAPANILDLGSGTGYFYPQIASRFPDADYLGLDLAEGMVRYAREQHPQARHWLVADAETLPLASQSVDLIFSSLALQWCHRPALLFAELARVLRPGGRCVFTSLGPETLKELRASWAAVDQHQHVNHFLPAQALLQAVDSQCDVTLTLQEQAYRMEYAKVTELLHELKTLGAHNVNRDRPSGLTGRQALQGMIRAYEVWREEGILPATYQVYFGILEKT